MANATAKVLADYILNWYKGSTFPAPLTNHYIALLSTAPTQNNGTGLVEITGSSYARQVVGSSAWTTISQSSDQLHDQISNSNAIVWPAVTSTPYTVNAVADYDALTSGNLIAWVSVTSQSVSVGNQYRLDVGNFTLEF